LNLFSKQISQDDIDSWKLRHPLFQHKISNWQEIFDLREGKLEPEAELTYLKQALKDSVNLYSDIQVRYKDVFYEVIQYLITKRIDELLANQNAQEVVE